MLSNIPQKKTEAWVSHVSYFLMGLAILGAFALHAWMEANEACEKRWKVRNYQTTYGREGCMVEIAPEIWVKEKKVDETIKQLYEQRLMK